MSKPRRALLALAVLPLAVATAGEPAPALPPELLEFLAEEPAGGDGMEEALMSREVDRAMASAKASPAQQPMESDDDES